MTTEHPPSWHVIGQEHEVRYDATGEPVSHRRVHYRTASGIESSVSVPEHQATAANVAKAIHEAARNIEEVQHMTANTHPPEPRG